MKKLVDGVEVDMTAEEIAARQSEEAQWLSQKPKAALMDKLSDIDRKLWAQRWAREGILGLGELINLLRSCPENITTVADLVAWLRAIPAPGTGMQKLQAIEDSAKSIRTQISQL